MAEWIVEVRCSSRVEAKLGRKHRVSIEEVREAVTYGAVEAARWHDHPEHGRRLLAKGTTYAGRRLLVVLAPIDRDAGIWACKTARQWS